MGDIKKYIMLWEEYDGDAGHNVQCFEIFEYPRLIVDKGLFQMRVLKALRNSGGSDRSDVTIYLLGEEVFKLIFSL